MAGEDNDQYKELFAKFAAQQQELFDTTRALTGTFSNSVVIPGDKLNNVLLASVLIAAMVLSTIVICFYAGY